MSNLSRRQLLAGMTAVAIPSRVGAESGFRIDWQGGEQSPDIAASLAAQVALVERLKVSDAAMAFFRAQVIPWIARPERGRAPARAACFSSGCRCRTTIRCCSTN